MKTACFRRALYFLIVLGWVTERYSQSYPLGKVAGQLFVTVVYYHDCHCEEENSIKRIMREIVVMHYWCRNRAVENGYRLRVEPDDCLIKDTI